MVVQLRQSLNPNPEKLTYTYEFLQVAHPPGPHHPNHNPYPPTRVSPTSTKTPTATLNPHSLPSFPPSFTSTPTTPSEPSTSSAIAPPLRKLYAFAAHDPDLKNFRFGVSVVRHHDGKTTTTTAMFHRMEERTRQVFDKFHGYRAGFET
ncbi:MAG: hypothetical protein L6R40_008471 [Gallowayella cf. fulva]|nr:MAG: hypothetical protein L6R40_008471 [Xanthomendoza cf. fulva]